MIREPEVKKTFTGCRLIKRVWLPNAALQTNKLEVEYVYDSNNNIVEEKNFSNGNYYGYSVTYTYDLNGKIVASEPYSKAYHYDAAGHLVMVDQAQGSDKVKYHYNALGLPDSSWT